MYIANVNIPFEKDFRSTYLDLQNYLPKHIFVYFRDRSENGEGNKGDVESICAKVTKTCIKKDGER